MRTPCIRWKGRLSFDNVEAVVVQLRELLVGRRYTSVWADARDHHAPFVHAGQELRSLGTDDHVFVSRLPDDQYAEIKFCDNDRTWIIPVERAEDSKPPALSRNPDFNFEGDKVTFTIFGGRDGKEYWTFAVESRS